MPNRQQLYALNACFLILSAIILSSCGSSSGTMEAYKQRSSIVRVSLTDPGRDVLIESPGEANVEIDGRTSVQPRNTRVLLASSEGGRILVTINGATPVMTQGAVKLSGRNEASALSYDGKKYTDTLLIVNDGSGLRVVNILPLETYLRGVVPSEIGADRSPSEYAAVQAQAVIARSYALARMRSPLLRLFDVYNDTRDQVYGGCGVWTELTNRAVNDTRGLVVAFEHRLAECFYHSTCGGRTEAPALVWGRPQSKPWLAGISDSGKDGDYCREAPSYRWTEQYSRSDLERILRKYLPGADNGPGAESLGDGWYLYDVQITARHPSNRVAVMQITMGNGENTRTFTVENDRVRWALRRPGGAILRSSLFDVTLERDSGKWIKSIRIDGMGNGHGIGLCQWGAIGRARKGQDFRAILKAYYPGTEVMGIDELEDMYAAAYR
jgi:stage II sporulation protein D